MRNTLLLAVILLVLIGLAGNNSKQICPATTETLNCHTIRLASTMVGADYGSFSNWRFHLQENIQKLKELAVRLW